MLTFKQYLKLLEHLTDTEREQLHSKNFDTTKGEQLFKGIMPEGQTHIEIPISSPLELRIRNHFRNNPIIDQKTGNVSGHWQWDGSSDYAQHPIHSNRTQRVSSIISDDEDLLKDYSNAKSLSGDKSRIGNVDTGELSNDKYKIIITRHPYGIFGKSSKLKPWTSCARPETEKDASAHLIDDINEGGAVAYLVHKDEPNPNDPEKAIGRVSLNPFIAETGHTILRAAPNFFGVDDEQNSFLHTVRTWAEHHFPLDEKSKSYTLSPNVYQNDVKQKILFNNNQNIIDFNKKLNNGTLESRYITHARQNDYAKNVLNKRSAKKLTEQNSPSINTELVLLHISGHDIGKESINNITRHPDSEEAHELLTDYHTQTNNIGNEGVDNLLKYSRSERIKSKLLDYRKTLNELNEKIKNGTLTPSDLFQIKGKGYYKSIVTPKIYSILADDPKFHSFIAASNLEGDNVGSSALKKIVKNTDTHESLANAYCNGKYIPMQVIEYIANTPSTGRAHSYLATGLTRGRYLSGDSINAIAKNKDSDEIAQSLAKVYYEGSRIPDEALNSIAKNSISHQYIAKAYMEGEPVSSEIIDFIANSPESFFAHTHLTSAHLEGKPITGNQLISIAKNPNSTAAHNDMGLSHALGRIIPDEAIMAIAKNRNSNAAHTRLAMAHAKGKIIPDEAILAISKNRNSRDAHELFTKSHGEGKIIPDEAIKSIRKILFTD